MILVVVVLIYYVCTRQVHPNWINLLWIPVVLVHLGVMGMGLGLVISSLTTKYRDLTMLVGFGVSLLMYATPVVYPLSQLEDGWMKQILLINPVTMPMELFKNGILGKGTVEPIYMATSVIFTVVIAIFGIMVFNKVERTFMDTV